MARTGIGPRGAMALNFGQYTGADAPPPVPAPDAPFRIAVLADFSGRPAADRPGSLDGLKAVPLDPDDLDATLAAVAPSVTLGDLDGGDVTLTFSSLDDFHPDAVYRAADRFSDLSDEDEKSAYMKAILRHPAFQALESAWRGVDWLDRRARKGDRRADLVLYDISRAELIAAANADDDLTATPLFQLLVGKAVQGPKGKPWAAVVGLYPFEISSDDAQALGRVAKILTDAGGPFLGGLAPGFTDPKCKVPEDAADAWAELRQLPEAGMVGLAAPRFLLRQPYGENTRSIDAFAFEEFGGPADAAGYLWADPGLAVAAVLAQGYLKDGWGFQPAGTLGLAGMTAHAYRDADDEDQLTVVDRWLDRKAAERLTGFGVMTFQPVRGRDAVQLTAVHSVGGAEKAPAALYGRWGTAASAGPPRSKFGVSVVTQAAETAAAASAATSAVEATSDTASDAVSDTEPAADFAVPSTSSDESVGSSDAGGGSDLDALLAGLDSGTPTAESATEPPADSPTDPDLAALLNSLGGDETPPPDPAPPAEEPSTETSIDDLLKQLGGM